jgi:hypothetical protein
VFYARTLADEGIKVNALPPALRQVGLNAPVAATGDPAEATAGAAAGRPALGSSSPGRDPGPLVTGATSSLYGAVSAGGAPLRIRVPTPITQRESGWLPSGVIKSTVVLLNFTR